MFSPKVQTFILSEKVSKVRWVPETVEPCNLFLTGSWDMNTNFVRLWNQNGNTSGGDRDDFVPKCSDKFSFDGDITGLEFINQNTVVASCTEGYIALLNIQCDNEKKLTEISRVDGLHSFETIERCAPCTGIAVNGSDIATIGEDGRLNLLNANSIKLSQKFYQTDSISLCAVEYVSQQEVLVGNRMGLIRMIDVRASDSEIPLQSAMIACQDERNNNAVTCLTSHPMQKHVVLAGSEEGSITVWDLRNFGYPAAYLSAHSSSITEMKFHLQDPSQLHTAAEAGELWQWSQDTSLVDTNNQKDFNNPWLNGERAKSQNKVSALISKLRKSINSFDAYDSKIICGSDSEAVYFFNIR